MVEPEEVSFLKYCSRKIIILRDRYFLAGLYYFLMLVAAIFLIGFSLVKDKRYLYQRIEKGMVQTYITGYAIGETPDGDTQQYFDVGDLIYPNSGDSPNMFIATNITYSQGQSQMYWNIRACSSDDDWAISNTNHSSGVVGAPLQTTECYEPTGYWRDWAWCPTLNQQSMTYLISDFSNLYLNVVPFSEINLRDGDSYQTFGRSQRTSLERLLTYYTPNTSYAQETGDIIEISYEWEWTHKEADDHDWSPDVNIRNQTLRESLIPNSSNRTIHQAYAYHYQVGDIDMRDEYLARGIYLNVKSTIRIKEIDIVQIVNYIGFL